MLSSKDMQAIAQIYNVTLDQSKWPGTLDTLDRQIGSIGCCIFILDTKYNELTAQYASTKLLPGFKYYFKNGYDKSLKKVLTNIRTTLPEQQLISVRDLCKIHNRNHDTQIETKDIEAWHMDNFDIAHRYASPLHHQTEYADICAFHFGEMSKCNLQRSLSLANLYLPHLEKAVELTRPFKLLQARFNTVLSVLDRFHLGVAIFSTNGSLVVANTAAQKILERGDGIKLNNSKITVTHSSTTNAQFQKAFYTVSQLSLGQKNNRSQRINIPRVNNTSPYIADLSPLHSNELDVNSAFHGVLTIIVDPDDHSIIDVSGLELLFSLTSAEKQVCHLLVSGNTTEEIADIRNVNRETIRKQVNTILTKTQTRNRSELVHLAHTINIPIEKTEQIEDKHSGG